MGRDTLTNQEALRKWLTDNNMSGAALSRQLDTSISQVSALVRGARSPGPDMAQAIEEATDGFVPAAAWPKIHRPNSKKSVKEALLPVVDYLRREVLKKHKITTKECAKRTNTSYNHMVAILSARQIPSVHFAVSLEEAFGVDAEMLQSWVAKRLVIDERERRQKEREAEH